MASNYHPDGPPPPYQSQAQTHFSPPPGAPPGMAYRPPVSSANPFMQQQPYPPASSAEAQRYPSVSRPSSSSFRHQLSSINHGRDQPLPPLPTSVTQPEPYPPPRFSGQQTSPYAAEPLPPPHAPHRNGSVSEHARRYSGGSDAAARNDSSAARYREDPLDLLKQFDTIVVVDDSGSMNVTPEHGPGPSRWEEARDALAGVVHLAASKDTDGIDVHFLNSEMYLEGCANPTQVKDLFDSVVPDGPTPLGTKLEMLLLAYLDEIEDFKEKKARGILRPGQKEPKKRNYIVITDGAPTDDVESVILAIAKRLDAGKFPLSQVGFSFIQVGDDAEATEALHELDDAVHQTANVRDIVDTTAYSGMSLNADLVVKSLLGGINRRYDRKDRRSSTTVSPRVQ